MTNKTVTFTFANQTPAEMKVSQVTLGLNPVDSATAQKATGIMTDAINRFLPKLQSTSKSEYQAAYKKLMASKQFTVSFEMPKDDKKFTVRVNGTNVDIVLPLSDETSKSLKGSLDKVVSMTTAPTLPTQSPYLPSFEEQTLLLSQLEKSLQPTHPLVITQVITQSSKVAPPSHGIVYRFFAAIGNFFINLFSFDTSEKPKSKYAPLISKEHKAPSGSTPASTAQEKTDQIVRPGIAGIRPLENGNNICFINAVFQALMNMPEEMRQTLIAAHNEKIAKEAKEIEKIQEKIALEESTYSFSFPWSSSPRRVKLSKLEASREASIILNQALRTYTIRAKNPVWLQALRGFIPGSVGSGRQEDANELLVKIFDPLLEPLRNGVNAEGLPDMSTIPADIDPALRDSLGRFIHKFGEEKQLQLIAATEARAIELAALDKKDLTQLPPGGLRREIVASSILPVAIPNAHTALQDLVTEQLTMQKPTEQDNTSVYVESGVRGDYQVSQKRSVIESLGNPPEYITLQLKRFNRDGSKNNAEITLPKNNRITLVVDEKNEDYEIQTLVMHSGSTQSGHYFSYVRKNSAWFEANDSHVTRLPQLPDAVKRGAYLIFLKRVH